MNLHNKIKSILFTLLGFGILQAQNQDTKAKALLQLVNEKVNSYQNIQIDFSYVLENEFENIRQETRGKLTIEGDKYVLEILGIQRIFDGQKLFTISPEDEEVTIWEENSEDNNTISPSTLLNFFEEGYNYSMDIKQSKYGRNIQYIKLTPIDSESEIRYALLGVEEKTKHVYNLIEMGENATKTTLTIANFQTNITIPKSFFKFEASNYKEFYINYLD